MNKIKWVAWMVLSACLASQASASVVLSSTRIIYGENDPEAVVKVVNDGAAPSLLQVWLDDGNPQDGPDDAETPFVVSPPITRVEPGKAQTLRIHKVDDGLPRDRESVFWLNVLDIPPKGLSADAKKNALRVAFRTRIKLFYRPGGLEGNAADAAAEIQWKVRRQSGGALELEAFNPTPFHVNYVGLKIGADQKEGSATEAGMMIRPGTRRTYRFDGIDANRANGLEYVFVNDFGGTSRGEVVLNREQLE